MRKMMDAAGTMFDNNKVVDEIDKIDDSVVLCRLLFLFVVCLCVYVQSISLATTYIYIYIYA